MDLPAKVAIIIKNLPAYSRSVVRASKLELGGSWVWNFFLTFLMLDSSLFQILLNRLGLVRWWTADNVPGKVHYDWQECTFMVFSNFDMHRLGKIHQNHWKSTLVNLPSLKATRLKWAKIQLCKVAKIYRCPLPYMYKMSVKLCDFEELYLHQFSTMHLQIWQCYQFKGTLSGVKVDRFSQLVHVKSWKKGGKIYLTLLTVELPVAQ